MVALRTEATNRHSIYVIDVLPKLVSAQVSRNTITADGSTRGKLDVAIEGGDDPTDCAKAILDAVNNDVPELLFELGGQIGAQIAEQYEAGNDS